MYNFLENTLLFQNIPVESLPELAKELQITKQCFKKGEIILNEGDYLKKIGIVTEGMVLLEAVNIWGTTNLLGNASKGSVFGESYACVPEEKLMISARAAERTSVLFIDVTKILHSSNPNLAFNLLHVCALKNLQLSRRIFHTSHKTIRGRLMSYFSECAKKENSLSFSIPYNRQQLADYLSVERTALCNELSKMQKDHFILYHKNQFTILKKAKMEV